MSMKKLVLPLLAVAALMVAATGCGQQNGGSSSSASGEESQAYRARAAEIGGAGVDYVNPGQHTCPVTGKKLDQYYVDTDQGRVYLHSQDAKEKFKENPEKYISKVKQQE